jgi:conjugal transfer pilus assembly protein TraK
MKIGLSSALIVLACLALPALPASPDTCGPGGCDAAKEGSPAGAGRSPAPVPSVVQSNWKRTVLPQDAAKPPALNAKPLQSQPLQQQVPNPQAKPAGPTGTPLTLDTGFSEQQPLPDPFGMMQKVSAEIPTQVRLSNSDINRVICPVDIKDAIYSEEKGLAVNLSGKNAYLKFLVVKKDGKHMYSTTPSEVYFVCEDAVYTMIAMPARIPAQTIQLASGKAGTAKKNIELYKEFPFEKKVVTIVKRVYLNDVPDSFTKTVVNKRVDVFKDLEVTLRSLYAIEGEGLRVKEFEVRIPLTSTVQSISYKENDFLRTDVSLHPVAVSAESMTLRKGETSRVIVVERNEGGQL